jgi:hypothetical protein
MTIAPGTIKPDREKLEKLSKRLCTLGTTPDDTHWPATHQYTLRGVVTMNEVFLRKREEESLMEMDSDARVEPSEQWWKLAYQADRNDPVVIEVSEL